MKTKGAQYVWLNGEFIEWDKAQVPITTHALHYGTSVFEGLELIVLRIISYF
jgi:branched-chain amino acid aminotransferase